VISGVQKIIVPVEDQDKAKQWWTTVLGFEVVRDDSYGDERWIEITPPDHPTGPQGRAGAEPARG